MASSLPRRILVAAVAIPTLFALVYLGAWSLTAAVAVLAVLGTMEIFRLARARGTRPLAGIGLIGAAGAPVAVYLVVRGTADPSWVVLGGVSWAMLVMVAAVVARPPDERPLGAIAITIFGALYAGLLPAFLLVLRHAGTTPDALAATWLVFLPLAVTWICDSMAMAGGAWIGGAKFAPVISPNKTWAGTISGSVFATVAAPLYGILLLAPAGIALRWWELALLGLVLSIVGQVGDLAESLLKREAGVKDSGTILPGHGGILDRLDSLYWVLPVSVVLLRGFGVV